MRRPCDAQPLPLPLPLPLTAGQLVSAAEVVGRQGVQAARQIRDHLLGVRLTDRVGRPLLGQLRR